MNACIVCVAEALNGTGTYCSDVLMNSAGLKRETIRMTHLLRTALYPQIFGENTGDYELSPITVSYCLQQAADILKTLLKTMLKDDVKTETFMRQFFADLPRIKAKLETDIRAAYNGDPAAKSIEEIMLAYPAFEAISIYRLAHRLYELNLPIVPRIMTEYAHKISGIDIHPGATIGDYFFIDHGTGVVIGETCVIGDHVKLYQGVTLGAKSFKLDEDGNPVKGIKRHPHIGNHVIIYSGTTILGGNTVIGDNCVIGGNLWLTHSVDSGKIVLAVQDSPKFIDAL